jgi:hypothetical protein
VVGLTQLLEDRALGESISAEAVVVGTVATRCTSNKGKSVRVRRLHQRISKSHYKSRQ